MKRRPSNKNLDIINNLLSPTAIASISVNYPEWAVIATIVSFFFWKILKNYKDIDIEFTDWINKNIQFFTPKIVLSEDFRNGFILTYEYHLKERNKEKRENIRNIFLWYIIASDYEKEKFELERFYEINKRITVEELEFIKFLIKEIQPIQLNKNNIDAIKNVHPIEKWWRGLDFWIRKMNEIKPLTKYLEEYVYEMHYPWSETAKKNYNYYWENRIISNQMHDDYDKINNKYKNLISWLNSLWLLIMFRDDSSWVIWWWGVHDYYNFSILWEKYIKFIANIKYI